MGHSSTYVKTNKAVLFAVALGAVLLTVASLFVYMGTASGLGNYDSSTLGLGVTRTADDIEFDAASKLGLAPAEDKETASALSAPTKRSVSSEYPQPVVELAAVDLGDPVAIQAAARYGVLNPPKEAKRLSIDTSGEGWQTGQASGYDVASSSTLTRSGRAFDDDCVTVAVPEGMEDLLGHPVVIVYDGMVVVATVTDTGGFAKYGRALDLGGGVFKAFGFEDIWEWGVREVHYKFL